MASPLKISGNAPLKITPVSGQGSSLKIAPVGGPGPLKVAPVAGSGGSLNITPAGGGAPLQIGDQPQQQGGGGILGSVMGAVHKLMQPVHAVAKDLNGDGYVGQQVVKASDLIAHIPGGIAQGLNIVGNDIADPNAWVHPLTFKDKQQKAIKALGVSQVKQTEQVIHHPAANLLQTALTVLPVASGVARVGLAGADAAAVEGGVAAKASTFGKAVVKPEIPARVLRVPQLVQDGAVGPVTEAGEAPLALRTNNVLIPGSKGSIARVLQKGHDAIVQGALNKVPSGNASVLARYGAHRVAQSIEEGSRIKGGVQSVQASQLERAARDSSLTKDETGLAHFLAANQVTPEEMAAFARAQAGKVGQKTVGLKTFDEAGMPHVHGAGEAITSTDAARLSHVANVAESLAQKRVLGAAGDKVAVNAEQFPATAASYEKLKAAQDVREQIVVNHGLVGEDTAAARKNLVGEKIGTGRPGEAFTTLKTRQPIPPKGSFARATLNKVIPRAKRLSTGPLATGSGLERGMIPANPAAETAAGLRAAQRFQNTTDLRGDVANLGSAVRTTTDDVLVAKQATQGKFKVALPDDMKVLMGKLTDNSISPEEEQALHGKFQNFVHDHLINHNPEQAVGQRAPEGWAFVHKNLVPNSLSGETPTGGIGKFSDTLNSAITSATVYTKLGHLPQRVLTNATANAVQTLNPLEVAKSVVTARGLPDQLKSELEAATGGHASMAPLSGVTAVNKVVRAGRYFAGGWARRVDAPFRLNSVLYELRQAGIKTPEQINDAVKAIKDPSRSGLSGSQIMKIDGAVRRSNRAAMMYDGMSNAEKARVAKYMWFYPWTKAAVRFAGHTVAEHPVKAAGLGQAGQYGTNQAHKALGNWPSYEHNLTAFSGGSHPMVSDLAALSPYGTTADLMTVMSKPFDAEDGLPSLANPVLSGVENVIKGGGIKGAIRGIVSPTPEYQVGSAIANPKGSGVFPTTSKNLFGASWQSTLVRGLTLGTATPRRVNKSKLNEYYTRQHEKSRTITIYSPK